MDAIVAVYEDWGIGRDGTQPVVIRADRKHFRDVTGSSAVIVGRKTLEDFPGGRPLKGRHNIVLTRQNIDIPEAEIVHNAEEACAAAALHGQCFVIGGASVYRELFDAIDRVFVTKIAAKPVSDSFFPNLDLDPAWKCIDSGETMEEDGLSYRFCTYERIK